LNRIDVESATGVSYPNHGMSPLLFGGYGRLYPAGPWIRGGRLSPYLAAGAGGTLVSVDLDNINDQELRSLWTRSIALGVKVLLDRNDLFLDIELRSIRFNASGPVGPFTATAVIVSLGGRSDR
jgi:hypothetical protein